VTHAEKEIFCGLMASLLSLPEMEMVEQISSGKAGSFFARWINAWGGDKILLSPFRAEIEPEAFFRDWQEAYRRSFCAVSQDPIPLAESFYKPWTRDPECRLPFATEKGHLMGDSALHMLALLKPCGLAVPEEFQACPDHLVIELEFLSFLYSRSTDREIKKFIADHLDWIPCLEEEFSRHHIHPLYAGILKLLDLFLNQERERLEIKNNGSTSIH
jgi:TorA maturation chaperone TorD